MALFRKILTHGLLKNGIASLAAVSSVTPDASAAIAPKRPGETKIVAVMGDSAHNPISQENNVRRIFSSKKDWRIIFVRAGRFFTPELLSDTDLLITARYSGNDSIAWTTDGLVDSRGKGDPFWTDEQVKAIIDNVRTRGMGFMPVHCTIACQNAELLDFMDVARIRHKAVQPLWVFNLNQEHPVTKDISSFYISLDEQFAAVIKSKQTTSLFETTAMHDKHPAVGGWSLERGKGRIVGLLPGHLNYTYNAPEYREIFWRAAHWAMKRDIPAYQSM